MELKDLQEIEDKLIEKIPSADRDGRTKEQLVGMIGLKIDGDPAAPDVTYLWGQEPLAKYRLHMDGVTVTKMEEITLSESPHTASEASEPAP
jgi:hypothetical protein